MAKISAKDGVVLVGGYNLSTYFAQYDIGMDSNPIEVTGFGDGWKNYIPGEPSGEMTLAGWWDSAAGKSVEALKSLGSKVVSVIPDGYVLGNPSISIHAEQEAFKPTGKHAGALELAGMRFLGSGIDAGPVPGVALCHQTCTNTLTTTGFVDPSGGAVTARCAGFLHVWSLCASDTYVIKIQHCATIAGVYADLVTFTLNGSALGSEHILVASGAIQQYRRVLATRTGAAGDTLGLSVLFWHA